MRKEVETHEMPKKPGGLGQPMMATILGKEELGDKGRLYAKITLKPGESIGLHRHEGEWEAFYGISGRGIVTIDSRDEELSEGVLSFTPSGSEHTIRCEGEEPLVMMALILNE